MRTEDLNNDGESDCVGLHVQDLRIITDPRISVESLGKDFSRNGHNYPPNFILMWDPIEANGDPGSGVRGPYHKFARI